MMRDFWMSMAQHDKAVSALSRAIKQLIKKKEVSDGERLDLLKKTLKAAQPVSLDNLIGEINKETTELDARIAEQVKWSRGANPWAETDTLSKDSEYSAP